MWAAIDEFNLPRVFIFALEEEARKKIIKLMQSGEQPEPWLPKGELTIEQFNEAVTKHNALEGGDTTDGMVQHQTDVWEGLLDEQWIGENGSWRLLQIKPGARWLLQGFDSGDRNTWCTQYSPGEDHSLGDGSAFRLDLQDVHPGGEYVMKDVTEQEDTTNQ